MTRAGRTWAAIARRLIRESRGAVIIEMAFAIPFLILVGFGGLEVANLVYAHTRISQMGLSAADNASRIAFGGALALPQVRERDINDVLAGVEKQAGKLDFQTHGRIILSSLEVNDDGGQWIRWQRCYGNLDVESSYGEVGDGETGTELDGMGPAGRQVSAPADSAVMFVEIVYDYQPLMYARVLGTRRIYSTAAFNVREGRDLTQIYNNEDAPVSSCD